MNQGIAKLAECLAGTLKDDNEIRKQAEQELINLSQNPSDYFSNLIQIITLNHHEISNQLRNSAALAVKKMIKEKSEVQIKTEERIYYVNHIFSALISNGLDSTLRGSLGYSLVPLFSGQSDVLIAFLPILTQAMNGSTASIFGSIRAIKSIFGGFVYNSMLYGFFKRIAPGLLGIAGNAVALMKKSMGEGNNMVALECTEILHDWSTTINTIFEYFDITCKETLSEIKDNTDLADIFKEIIMIIHSDSGLSQASLINVTPSQISIKLNKTKTELFQAINVIIQYMMDNKKKIIEKENKDTYLTPTGLDMPESPFLNLISELLQPILSTLQVIINTLDTNQLLEYEYISEIFIELILILQKSCTDNRFLQFFVENHIFIIVYVCLPLIKCTQADMETFEESPEEFVSLSADVCERQESETIKSTAAGLLETICQKVDGSLKFLLKFSEVLIGAVIKQSFDNCELVSAFTGSELLKSSDELKVETCLISLCIVSFLVSKRSDLIKQIEKIMTEFLSSIYTQSTPLIKNRVCMMIHYYCEFIFQDEENAFRSLLLLIIRSCDPKVIQVASVNFQASETLSHILQEEELMSRIYPYVPDLMNNLITLIDYQEASPFFEALQEIITNNTNLIVPYINQLVPSLVNKVIKEAESKKNKKSRTSIVLVKCWNIIRHLVEYKGISTGQVLELEQMFLPLFKYIENPKQIEFDDDIILFEVSVMRRCQRVTEIGWNIFTQLGKVQDKYDNTFVQIFQILNCYIHFGKDLLVTNIKLIENICEMCGKCLFAIYKSKINEATNAEGALILHQVLFTFSNYINDLLPSIIAFAIMKLETVIKQNFFKARLLGIILASFDYNFQLTYNILTGSLLASGDSYLQFVLNEINSNTHIFRHPYDKKVAVKGLSAFFINAQPADKVVCFQVIIEILSNSWKDMISLGFGIKGDTDEPSLKENFKDFNSEELEANLALTTFFHPLSDFDEYEYFRSMVKSFNPDDLKILVSNLNQIQVEKLMNILKSKRVQIGDNSSQTDVRRVVTPKYHLNK